MKLNKIILAPSIKAWEEFCLAGLNPMFYNSVEAEYGDEVIVAGGAGVTLAHHGSRSANPAPCITEVKQNGMPIVVSHSDLDTLGGVMAIAGIKPANAAFWNAAAFVDINGPHRAVNNPAISAETLSQLRAFWAWNEAHRLPRVTEVTEITASVQEAVEAVISILSGNEELLAAGEQWAAEIQAATESKLIYEDPDIRVFVTDGVFCSASYYSPKIGSVAKATVVLNTKTNAITVAFEDGGKKISAKDLVRKVWGPEAGGHNGIAGSPRGKKMTIQDMIPILVELVKEVK